MTQAGRSRLTTTLLMTGDGFPGAAGDVNAGHRPPLPPDGL
jgi:hypothetical protein